MCSLAQGAEFIARVIAVLDGDTVLVQRKSGADGAGRQQRSNEPVKIRLAEIDAPEKAQTFGETSRRSLSDMVLGKQVKITSQAVDQYGRLVAHLSMDGLDVNAEQIRRGMAWEYSHFHGNHELIALEAEARQAPRGLWALSDPIPPWEWRKLHPNIAANQSHAAVLPIPIPATAPSSGFNCGGKKHCSQMASCEEAKYYLTQCGIKTLDGNGDGIPCESLCNAQK